MNEQLFIELIWSALYEKNIEIKRQKIDEYNNFMQEQDEQFVQFCLSIIIGLNNQYEQNVKDIVSILLYKNVRLKGAKTCLVTSSNKDQYYQIIIRWLQSMVQQRQSLTHQILKMLSYIINLYMISDIDCSPFMQIIQQYIVLDNQLLVNAQNVQTGFNHHAIKLTGIPLLAEICQTDFLYTNKYGQIIKDLIQQIGAMNKSEQETYYYINAMINLGYQSNYADTNVQFVEQDDVQTYFQYSIQALQTIQNQQLYAKTLHEVTEYLQQQSDLIVNNTNLILDMFQQLSAISTQISQYDDMTMRQVMFNIYIDGLDLFQIVYTNEDVENMPNDIIQLFMQRIVSGLIVVLNSNFITEEMQHHNYQQLVESNIEYQEILYVFQLCLDNRSDDQLIQEILQFDTKIEQYKQVLNGSSTQYQHIQILFLIALYKMAQYQRGQEEQQNQIHACTELLKIYHTRDEYGKILIMANQVEVFQYNNDNKVIMNIIFTLFGSPNILQCALNMQSEIGTQTWLDAFYYILVFSRKHLNNHIVKQLGPMINSLILTCITTQNTYTLSYTIQLLYKAAKYELFDITQYPDVMNVIKANYSLLNELVMTNQILSHEQQLLYRQIFKITILYSDNPCSEINNIATFLLQTDDYMMLSMMVKKIKNHVSKYDINLLKYLLSIFIQKKQQNSEQSLLITNQDDILSDSTKINMNQYNINNKVNKTIHILVAQCVKINAIDKELHKMLLTLFNMYFNKQSSAQSVTEFIQQQDLLLNIFTCVLQFEIQNQNLTDTVKLLEIIFANINNLIINSKQHYFDLYRETMETLTQYVDIQSIITAAINGINQTQNQMLWTQLSSLHTNISEILNSIIDFLLDTSRPHNTSIITLCQKGQQADDSFSIDEDLHPDYSDYYVFCKAIQKFTYYSLVKQQNTELLLTMLECTLIPTLASIISSVFEYMELHKDKIQNIVRILDEIEGLLDNNYDLILSLYFKTGEANLAILLMHIYSNDITDQFKIAVNNLIKQHDQDTMGQFLNLIKYPYQCILALTYSLNYQFDISIIEQCLQWLQGQRILEKYEEKMIINTFVTNATKMDQKIVSQYIDMINSKICLQRVGVDLQNKYYQLLNNQQQHGN